MKEYITQKINKVLMDELTSATIYIKMAESLIGLNMSETQEILKEHADEEFNHFKRIMEFAHKRGLNPIVNINSIEVNSAPVQLVDVIIKTQALEQQAIDDYTEICEKAKENNQMEVYHFFYEILKEELEHFDELAPFLGQSREFKQPCQEVPEEDILVISQENPEEKPDSFRKLFGI